MRVFLDANILFSASLGGEVFDFLWSLEDARKILLFTSSYCYVEAFDNLQRKRPDRLNALSERMKRVHLVTDNRSLERSSIDDLPDKDVPVFWAAVNVRADVLLTGDRKHFGPLMNRDDLPLRVRTVRNFLLEGPIPLPNDS